MSVGGGRGRGGQIKGSKECSFREKKIKVCVLGLFHDNTPFVTGQTFPPYLFHVFLECRDFIGFKRLTIRYVHTAQVTRYQNFRDVKNVNNENC